MNVPSSASRRARTATCISAMRSRRSSISRWRARRAGGFCCASRTSTRRAAGRNSSRRSTRIWPGSASPGRSRCAARASISTTIARRSPGSRRCGLVYPSFESRGEIAAAGAPSASAATALAARSRRCAALSRCMRARCAESERRRLIAAGEPYALRLDMAAAIARAGALSLDRDRCRSGGRSRYGLGATAAWGDVVLARKDTPTSYHLAVVARRCPAGRDPRRARAGSVLGDQRPSAPAGAARPAGADLPSPPPDSRCWMAESSRNRLARRHCARCGTMALVPATSGEWSGSTRFDAFLRRAGRKTR